ncbi:MBL fold hydrolase [Candidatus Marinamargulisbacteria bacterium SCGC AG-343-D04]|nr:MBL fold hydrolase [Candidatus Marinamargulisbacteria bacterium SCGC AG-343-D04]
MIIDPGANTDHLFELSDPYDVTMIVLTHCHIDHAGGVKHLRQLFKEHGKKEPSVLYHSQEIIIGEYIETIALQYGLSPTRYQNAPSPDEILDNKDVIELGDSRFKCLFTPGHSPGHVALYYENDDFLLEGKHADDKQCNHLLIAGDTLFYGSIGRTDLPMGNHEQLLESIRTQLLVLPEDTVVCSGHGPNTTIRHEKLTNPFLEVPD